MKGTLQRCLLAAATLAATHAAAQDDAQRTSAEPTLRPVVVTPTPGVAQDAFDTPASVDVVSGEQLRNAQLQVNLSEGLARVPGVVALNRQNYAQDLQISIRGFGARSTFGVRGLRMYSDGIPATAPDGQGQVSHFDLSSADRVEVLRGPFSSLYGNSSGGVISIFTADGAPGKQLEGGSAIGSDGVRRQNLRFAGEEGAWNWNFGASHFETEGFRAHSAARRDGFNGKLRYAPSGDTRVTFVANTVDMPDVQDPLGLTRAELARGPRTVTQSALDFNTRKSTDQAQAGLIIEQRFNEVHSAKVTTWRGQRNTQQFQAIPVSTQTSLANRDTHPGGVISLAREYGGLDAQWIARTRLFGGPLVVTGGLASDALSEERKGYRNFTGPPAAPTALGVIGEMRRNERNRVATFDQYAQGQWDSDKLSLTAGLRHSVVRFQSRDLFIASNNGDDSGSARYAATTPAVGAVYHVNEHLNVYASAGRGFETPTFNELAYRGDGQPGLAFGLRPARSRQYEVGVKAEPRPGWRVNSALFLARTADEISVLSNTGGRSTFQNVGDTRRRGLETAVTGELGGGWATYAALTYLDAAYTSPFLTCAGTPCAAPTTPVAAGSRIPGIPRVSAYAELAWRHKPWGLETALEMRHVGRIAVDDRNTDFAAASTIFNLRLAVAQKRQRWTWREFIRVDNVAGRNYVGSVIVNEGNGRFFEPAPGRTWLLGLNASYAF